MNFDDLDLSRLRARTGEKWRTYGSDVLAAWVADMDFPVAPPLAALLRDTAENSDVGYPVNADAGRLAEIFAERAQRLWNWSVDPGLVRVITDVVQGLYAGIHIFSEPGDAVLVQTPIYPPFLSAPPSSGRRLLCADLVAADRGYTIDFDALRALIDERTRILLFCNPHNPTGRVFTRDELERVAQIAIEHDLIVLSDEIHADLVYAGHAHVPFASLGPEANARTITLTSATKAFNIAGLRCAVAIAGTPELYERLGSLPRHLLGGMGSIGLAATRIAWTECSEWLDSLTNYLQSNRDYVASFVANELPGVVHTAPEGTYLAWLDCRALDLARSPAAHFLEHARVALSDGKGFGAAGAGFARINFATSRSMLTEVLERMAKSLVR